MKTSVLVAFVFLLSTVAFCSQPREIAEKAVRAWNAGDASSLFEVCHPELIQRMRTSRILREHLEDDIRNIDPTTIPEWRVVYLFCEALRRFIPPRDPRYIYREDYLETKVAGDITIVRFRETIAPRDDTTGLPPRFSEVVLKRDGDELRFLWFLPAAIHIDLLWDPRSSELK